MRDSQEKITCNARHGSQILTRFGDKQKSAFILKELIKRRR